MTLKEYLSGKNLIFVQYTNGIIFNVITDVELTGLKVDTSNINSGTPLITTENFTYINDILSVDNIQINANDVEML